MADATNVGAVNIELGIESKIEEQLNKILGSVESAVKTRLEKPLNGIGDAVSRAVKSATSGMEAAVEKPIKNTKAKIDAVSKEISDISGKDVSLDAVPAEKALESVAAKAKQTSDEIDAMIEATLNRSTKAKEFLTPKPATTSVSTPVAVPRAAPAASAVAPAAPAAPAATEQIEKKVSAVPEMFHAATDAAGLLEQKLANISAQIGEQETKLSSLLTKYRDVADEKGAGSDEAGTIDSQITAVQSKLINLQQASIKTESALEKALAPPESKVNEKIAETTNKLKTLEQTAPKVGASVNNALGKNMMPSADTPARKVEKSFSRVTNSAKKSGNKISAAFKGGFSATAAAAGKVGEKIKGSFSAAGTSVSKKFGKLAQGIKSTFKAVFVTSALYAGFRAIKEAISSAATQNDDFAKALSTVKANLSVAFTPIINAVLPILTKFISAVAAASQYVATFVSGIFGKTYAESLTATKSLKKVQSEAKKAKGALASFDKITTLSTGNSDADKESDSGLDNLTPDAEVQGKVDGLMAKLKGISFEDVGTLLGSKLNGAVQKITDTISWENAGAGITSGIGKVTGLINNFVDTTDWFNVGNMAAQLINTFTNSIEQFIDKINWKSLGKAFGDGVNGIFKNVDFKKSGKTIAKGIDAVITYLRTAITTVDWKNIGKAAADWVNALLDIDWGALGGLLSDAVKSALSLVTSVIDNIDWAGIPGKIFAFFKGIDWLGLAGKAVDLIISALCAVLKLGGGLFKELWNSVKNLGRSIIDGIASGISVSDMLSNVGGWIKKHIFEPFINAFKSLFGIHSPSTVFADLGGNIIAGLVGGITGAIKKVKEVCGTILSAIKNIFVSVPEWFSNVFSNAWRKVKDVFCKGGEIFKSIASGIADVFKKIVNHIIDGINTVISLPFREINFVLGKIKDVSIFGAHPFDFIPTIPTPQIPKLATGGIVSAPTLAMVGDNPHAVSDPEVVSPLSKLKGMIGGDGNAVQLNEVITLLEKIYELLQLIVSSKGEGGSIADLMEMINGYNAKMRLRTNGGV